MLARKPSATSSGARTSSLPRRAASGPRWSEGRRAGRPPRTTGPSREGLRDGTRASPQRTDPRDVAAPSVRTASNDLPNELLAREIRKSQRLVQAELDDLGRQRAGPAGVRRDEHQRARDVRVPMMELDRESAADRQPDDVRTFEPDPFDERGEAVGVIRQGETIGRIRRRRESGRPTRRP
jgi:hypothetical protein